MQNKNQIELVLNWRAWFKNIKPVYCPTLSTNVVFNTKGFNHLLYDGRGYKRNNEETAYRLSLLPMAIEIIKEAQKVDEYRSTINLNVQKTIEFWSLKKGIGREKITVILRRIGNGQIIFYSVWRKSRRK